MSERSIIKVVNNDPNSLFKGHYCLFTNAQFPFEVQESIEYAFNKHCGDHYKNLRTIPSQVSFWIEDDFMQGYVCKRETDPNVWFYLDYYYELNINSPDYWELTVYEPNHPIIKDYEKQPPKNYAELKPNIIKIEKIEE